MRAAVFFAVAFFGARAVRGAPVFGVFTMVFAGAFFAVFFFAAIRITSNRRRSMRPTVRTAFHTFSKDLEGRLRHPYLCTAGKVTIAMGVMLPTPAALAALPLRRKDGTLATDAEKRAEWHLIASLKQHMEQGGGYYDRFATLRLSWEDVDRVTDAKLDVMERELRGGVFPGWDSWCDDLQLFGLSWGWAVGPAHPYPKMIAAINSGDFDTAVLECDINPKKGTIVERNRRNKVLLENAKRVRDYRLDPTVVYWPRELAVVDREAETLRELPTAGPSSAPGPVLEEDGGDARRDATTDAILEAARAMIARRRG